MKMKYTKVWHFLLYYITQSVSHLATKEKVCKCRHHIPSIDDKTSVLQVRKREKKTAGTEHLVFVLAEVDLRCSHIC